MSNFRKGDHLVAERFGYTHHGLYVGGGNVIHYLASGVTLDSVETFADGEDVWVREHSLRMYKRKESVSRAYSRLGDDSYNVVFNNCEHFVYWCICGLHRSPQVERTTSLATAVGCGARAYMAGGAVATEAGAGLVAGTSTAAKLGASAFVGTGSAVAVSAGASALSGAGAAAGVAALGAGTSALAGAGTMAGVAAAGVASTVLAPVAVGTAVAVALWSWLSD